MARAIQTPEARQDVINILRYLTQRSPVAAQRTSTRIRRAYQHLASFPLTGRPRPNLGPDVRSFAVTPYVIYFSPDPGGVVILRVFHSRQNVTPDLIPG